MQFTCGGRSFCNREREAGETRHLGSLDSRLASDSGTGQIDGRNTATMSDLEQRGLRGTVKSCTEESTRPGVTDAYGKTYPEVHLEYTTEYDTDGRMLVTRSRNSDGSQWMTRNGYDASGRLLKTASGVEGKALKQKTGRKRHRFSKLSRSGTRSVRLMI